MNLHQFIYSFKFKLFLKYLNLFIILMSNFLDRMQICFITFQIYYTLNNLCKFSMSLFSLIFIDGLLETNFFLLTKTCNQFIFYIFRILH